MLLLTGTVVVTAPTRLLVGCVLLLTGTVVVTAPTRLLMGCVLLLTGAVLIIPIASSVLANCMLQLTGALPVLLTAAVLIGTVSVAVVVPTVLGEVVSSGIDAMDRNTQYSTLRHKIQNRNV